jgi:hypothetical protein
LASLDEFCHEPLSERRGRGPPDGLSLVPTRFQPIRMQEKLRRGAVTAIPRNEMYRGTSWWAGAAGDPA